MYMDANKGVLKILVSLKLSISLCTTCFSIIMLNVVNSNANLSNNRLIYYVPRQSAY